MLDTAQVVSIEKGFGDPKVHAQRIHDSYYQAFLAMQNAAVGAGLPVHCDSLFSQMFNAGHRLADFWQRRAHRLDRALRVALASDCVSDQHRAEIVAVLVGSKKLRRDKKLLSEAEGQLIADYRRMDTDGKQMLRTLLSRIANSTSDGGGR
jgi:hypothetical protein